jgi:hypothetical protein
MQYIDGVTRSHPVNLSLQLDKKGKNIYKDKFNGHTYYYPLSIVHYPLKTYEFLRRIKMAGNAPRYDTRA